MVYYNRVKSRDIYHRPKARINSNTYIIWYTIPRWNDGLSSCWDQPFTPFPHQGVPRPEGFISRYGTCACWCLTLVTTDKRSIALRQLLGKYACNIENTLFLVSSLTYSISQLENFVTWWRCCYGVQHSNNVIAWSRSFAERSKRREMFQKLFPSKLNSLGLGNFIYNSYITWWTLPVYTKG